MLEDLQVRLATFRWLDENVDRFDGVFPRGTLEDGFTLQGERIPLVGPQGIFKPKVAQYPLSITTTTNSPYSDSEDSQGRLIYSYTGTDPNHWQNAGLRTAMQRQLPLVYFKALLPGRYAASYPAYIVGDDPSSLEFTVLFGEAKSLYSEVAKAEDDLVRQYITRETKIRLHQKGFREIVLRAYNERCACCHLGHRKLLDAAHIVADKEPEGLPIVKNGLALCKLHHAAFDGLLFGIRPNLSIEVREDIRKEKDGPMLVHGLQGLHLQRISAPEAAELSPDPELLETRFELFKKAG